MHERSKLSMSLGTLKLCDVSINGQRPKKPQTNCGFFKYLVDKNCVSQDRGVSFHPG